MELNLKEICNLDKLVQEIQIKVRELDNLLIDAKIRNGLYEFPTEEEIEDYKKGNRVSIIKNFRDRTGYSIAETRLIFEKHSKIA